jgi:hypothetical protein
MNQQGRRALAAPSFAFAVAFTAACSADPAGPSDGPPGGGPSLLGTAADWDWAGIVGTGQSLSVGAEAGQLMATQQPYGNIKLSLGDMTAWPLDPKNAQLAMVPLVEPVRPLASSYPSAYPWNLYGETPHTAMANQIAALAQAMLQRDAVTAHTVVGESGQPISVIRKGAVDTGTMGRAYEATLFEARAIARLAKAANKTYGMAAVVLTHGESDAGTSSYANELFKLVSDYSADIAPITGQKAKLLMIASQQNAEPHGMGGRPISTTAVWRAGMDHPEDIVCSGPKYQYEYAPDGIHLVARGYDRLGEKYGQVYFERLIRGRDWQPLQPMSVTRPSVREILVRFHVPVPPLVFDDTMPPPHQTVFTEWAMGRGFEVRAVAAMVVIESVTIEGDDSVRITVGSDLPASGVTLSYAMTADGTAMPGGTFHWGQLRDSDPLVGAVSGAANFNYAVTFEMTVP